MTSSASTDRRPYKWSDAQRHTETRVRIGRRPDGTACEHPYEPDEPSGYIAWHEWAAKKQETHEQEQCPDCGLHTTYTPKAARLLVECPYCGAAPGVACHALSHDDHWLYELKRPHRARKVAH